MIKLRLHEQCDNEEHPNRVKVLLLGSGWAAIPFLKHLNPEVAHTNYDVTMVSPRNYFLYSPLLPSMHPDAIQSFCWHGFMFFLETRSFGFIRRSVAFA